MHFPPDDDGRPEVLVAFAAVSFMLALSLILAWLLLSS